MGSREREMERRGGVNRGRRGQRSPFCLPPRIDSCYATLILRGLAQEEEEEKEMEEEEEEEEEKKGERR
ncbi:hypothetical protein E2C01_098301 [Portunus trituberculatus]|uniref:Uncharacterized protein n=1 Tax=Portunus trituberculatus TaxID=210409 RepID=A0A5B7K7W9_PORTR|nr:hypothetical protein [Portunus trituberculatus]